MRVEPVDNSGAYQVGEQSLQESVKMDPFSPEAWKHQWEVLMSAPYVFMQLIALALTVGWWIGTKLAGARVEVLEERLKLAVDQERYVQHARTELEKRTLVLRAQITAGASNEALAVTSAKVGVAINELSTANNALTVTLTDQNPEPQFYAQLEQPGQADRLKEFVASLRPLGVEPRFEKSLFLRWRTTDGKMLSAGTIEPTGSIWLLKTVTDARAAGIQPGAERYLETIAQLVNGSVKRSANGSSDVRGPDGRSLRLPTLIEFAPLWKDAIGKLISDTLQQANN